MKVVCSFLHYEEYDDGEVDWNGSALPLTLDSISQHDIKSHGAEARSSILHAKQALSGKSDNSLCLDKELVMVKQM